MKKIFLVLISVLLVSVAYAQVPISSLRMNNANGSPVDSGQVKTITGIVTVANEFGGPSYMQDNTAGIAVYDPPFSGAVTVGDSVNVTGILTHYQGLTQLMNVTYTIVSSGKTVVPLVVNFQQYNNQAWNGFEQYEGRLLKFNNCTMTSTGLFAYLNYNISDSTGAYTGMLRIDNNTNIIGTLIPTGTFSMVAVGSQYKTSVPYSSGYQVLPRFTTDFTSSGGPVINTTLSETNILQNSVTINWTTLNASDSKVKYFRTDSNYQAIVFTDSVYNEAMVTSHSVTLSNLRPGKIYYATAYSTNGNGTSTSIPKYFSTSSHASSTGKMEIYFNRSVNTTLALPNNNANGLVDFKVRLGQRIDSATKSIDLAIYSFNEVTQIKDKLINAYVRGVKIRMVYDSRTNQALVNDLISAGIKVQKRNFDTGKIMHDKFFIFDSRDTSSYTDDWLWGGSANMTTDQFYNDAQNVILIQDEALCNTYTREFEEMWGSHTDNNDGGRAKFGSAKSDNTPHLFYINGKRVECFFSPSDGISNKIENLIDQQTNKSINFCALDFTRYQIANKMKAKYNPPTLMVRGVFDDGVANDTNGMYWEMKGNGSFGWNPAAKVWVDGTSGLLHHKYILIDADMPSSNPVVETGSYNYSTSAETGNDENVLFLFDSLAANQYYQEFAKRIADAGGSLGVENITSGIPQSFKLFQNYPNPFNPSTKISFEIPSQNFITLKIYDQLGREVATLVNEKLNAGTYEVNWNAVSLSSGVYFYQINAGSFTETKKLMLIK